MGRSGEVLPTSEEALLGGEVWPCAPAQLSLSHCRPGDVREEGGGGAAHSKSLHNDCSLCCGLASKGLRRHLYSASGQRSGAGRGGVVRNEAAKTSGRRAGIVI